MAADAGKDPDSLDVCFTPFSHPAHKDVVDPDAFVAEARALHDVGRHVDRVPPARATSDSATRCRVRRAVVEGPRD